MGWDRIEGNWSQFKQHVKDQWGKLTDHQLDRTAGRRDLLAQEIGAAYGISDHAAEWQLSGWQARMQHTLL
jgi:uncharacterized protein YjbJ (UPF0337 family)